MKEEKFKCWVAYDEEHPAGLVFESREEALDYSADIRSDGGDAYVRVKSFTKEEFEALSEAD